MLRIIGLLVLFLVACDKVGPLDTTAVTPSSWYTPPGFIPNEIQPYIQEYAAEASKRDANIAFSKLVAVTWVEDLKLGSQPLWGLCQWYQEPDGSKLSEIKLDTKLNTDASPTVKKLIIFHELSHCLMGIGHTTDDPYNVLQVMYPSSGWQQELNVPYYQVPEIWSQHLDFLFYRTDLEVSK